MDGENIRTGSTSSTLSHVSHSTQPLSNLSSPPPPRPPSAAAMMLVQKQPTLLFQQQHSSSSLSHRRHPSAPPVVIVQPTRTPGLLSLSKPPQKSPSPHRQLNPGQRTPQSMKQTQKPRPAQPVRPALLNAAEITDKKDAVRPPKAAFKLPKDAKQQATSDSPRTHGKHARQPSPPNLPVEPSQAEAFQSTASDPFLDSFAPTAIKPSPVPATRRSGKLAHRRHSQQNTKPGLSIVTPSTPSKAIPVPVVPRYSTQLISRSDPTLSHSWDHICDDSNDEGPTTPIRSRAQTFFDMDGPLTAPLSSHSPGAFPLQGSPSRMVKKRSRNHKRTPSDGVFAMSSDDEASSGVENIRVLLDFVRKGSPPTSTTPPPPQRVANSAHFRSLSPASREKFFELEAQKEVAGYFASSSFQNSPSPDDLPDPLFA